MARSRHFARQSRFGMLAVLMTFSLAAWADDYAAAWGPAIGSKLPVLEALDSSGAERNLGNLAGEHGLLLFMVRSADW